MKITVNLKCPHDIQGYELHKFFCRIPNDRELWIHVLYSHYIHYKVWDEITNPFPNYNSATIEIWKWISNFIPQFAGYMITYPCWDQS